MIQVNQLEKYYRHEPVLKSITLTFEPRMVYGLIGKNGVGKTTFLKQIAHLAHPTSGSVSKLNPLIVGCSFGHSYYEDLSIIKNVQLRQSYLNQAHATLAIDFLKQVGLWDKRKRKVSKLSLGMKQMVDLALAFIGEPNLLIFDEPLNGLDPENVIVFRTFLSNYMSSRQVTTIISSHDLGSLPKIANHFILMHDGRIIDQFSPSSSENIDSLEERFTKIIAKGYKNETASQI